jgi:flagellar biosynthesis protein
VSGVAPRGPLAVALRYAKPSAPRVVAVGRGAVGQKIIDVAREHGVPLEQNPELAQALSRVELDDEIPEQLYMAVALVLGFILRASAEKEPGPATPRSPPARGA